LPNKTPQPLRFSEAGSRAVLWCARTGATIFWCQAGAAWTEDDYQWPVATSTIHGLIKRGGLELDPQQRNHGQRYRVPLAVAAAITES
jgi:hypothetical protein